MREFQPHRRWLLFILTIILVAAFLATDLASIQLAKQVSCEAGTAEKSAPAAQKATTSSATTLAAAATTQVGTPRKVFVDLGANCGNSYLRLKQTNSFLTDDWEIYLWEANPQLVEWFLNDLAKQDSNRNIHVIKAAAATGNADLQFHLTKGQNIYESKEDMMEKAPNPTCDPNIGKQPGGASTLMEGAKKGAGEIIAVQGIDFTQWLQDLGLNFGAGDELALKIDIEGYEVPLLSRMLLPQFHEICHVSQFMLESHERIFPQHAAFFKQFPVDFKNKCGRPLQMMKWH